MKIFQNYTKMELRQVQLMQLELMSQIHNVCNAERIKYYLLAGSLLGAVRHGGFIPWDDDIDIGMPRKDYEKFKEVFSKHFDDKRYFLQYSKTDKSFVPALMRLCIRGTIVDIEYERRLNNCKNTYIDIFPLDNVPKDESLQIKQAKELKCFRRVIRWKEYCIYNENNILHKIIKPIVSFVLKVLPLSYLQNKRDKVMTRYSDSESDCWCSMASKYSYKKQTIDKNIYGQPTLIKFEDKEFFGPEKPIE